MTPARLDVVGVGNALVDVISPEEDSFLVRHRLVAGTMSLVDGHQATLLFADMGPTVQMSGGSAANTMVGIAALGGAAGYIGRVGDDEFGEVFAHDLRAAGVHFDTLPAKNGDPTGHCLVVVTPDAQRTMCTFLGASSFLAPEDVDEATVTAAQVVYLEGYLWDEPDAKDAFRHAAAAAHRSGGRVGLSLSDPFCVLRHREEFRELVEHHVDILFANEAEITALYEVTTFDDALQQVKGQVEIAALTRGAIGAVIVSRDEVHVIDPYRVDEVVDTTGAGDLFASGFLFGLTHGYDLGTAGRLGALAAGEIISHLGARPTELLSDLAAPLLAPRG